MDYYCDIRTGRAQKLMRAYTGMNGLGSGCTVKCDILHPFNKSKRNACKDDCAASDAAAAANQAAIDAQNVANAQAIAQAAAQAAANQVGIPYGGSGGGVAPAATPGWMDLNATSWIPNVKNGIVYAGTAAVIYFIKKKKDDKKKK